MFIFGTVQPLTEQLKAYKEKLEKLEKLKNVKGVAEKIKTNKNK